MQRPSNHWTSATFVDCCAGILNWMDGTFSTVHSTIRRSGLSPPRRSTFSALHSERLLNASNQTPASRSVREIRAPLLVSSNEVWRSWHLERWWPCLYLHNSHASRNKCAF